VSLPVRIRRLDGLGADARTRVVDRLAIAEVEDDQRLRMWRRRFVPAAARELEVSLRSRDGEKDAVVAVVTLERPISANPSPSR